MKDALRRPTIRGWFIETVYIQIGARRAFGLDPVTSSFALSALLASEEDGSMGIHDHAYDKSIELIQVVYPIPVCLAPRSSRMI